MMTQFGIALLALVGFGATLAWSFSRHWSVGEVGGRVLWLEGGQIVVDGSVAYRWSWSQRRWLYRRPTRDEMETAIEGGVW